MKVTPLTTNQSQQMPQQQLESQQELPSPSNPNLDLALSTLLSTLLDLSDTNKNENENLHNPQINSTRFTQIKAGKLQVLLAEASKISTDTTGTIPVEETPPSPSQLEEIRKKEEDLAARRRSSITGLNDLSFAENFDTNSYLNKLSLATKGVFDNGRLRELVQSYIDAVTLSSGDVRTDLGFWFDRTFPIKYNADDTMMANIMSNLRELFCEFGVKLRPLIKMARWGVGLRLIILASLSYFDVVTDFLVSKTLYEQKLYSFAIASLACVGLGMFVQLVWCCIMNYKKSWKVLSTRMTITGLGLAPLAQSLAVWRGEHRDVDVLMDPLMQLS
jgi:hypothetical protein